MAQVTIDVPNALVPRVLTALRATYPALTNGLGDLAAAKAVIRHLVRQEVIAYEAGTARQSAAALVTTAEADARTATEGIT